jgi:hypothetical protein
MIPIEQTTEQMTIKIPSKARVNPESILDGNFPIAIPTYKNINV